MKIEQSIYDNTGQIIKHPDKHSKFSAQFVMIFGAKELLLNQQIYNELRSLYPGAYLIGGTTAGEIYNNVAADMTLSATAVHMEQTPIRFASAAIENNEYFKASADLIAQFPLQGLKHIFIISEGININGSKLVDGLAASLPDDVTISGGLAGDGTSYKETFVIANDYPQKNMLAAIGFYGTHVQIGCASAGGWSPFGIERVITKSTNNILYKFDEKPALDLYKAYLGEYADELPAAGLYFPLMVRSNDDNHTFIRTIQRIDEKERALIFSGDVPQGYLSKLMRTNFDDLIDGSRQAAQLSLSFIPDNDTASCLAVLVSCVGRKLILSQMVSEEIDAARNTLGSNTVFTGFYSYGEIVSSIKNRICELHNQTMTITLITEV